MYDDIASNLWLLAVILYDLCVNWFYLVIMLPKIMQLDYFIIACTSISIKFVLLGNMSNNILLTIYVRDDYTNMCNNIWLMIDSIGDFANVLFNLNVML